MLSINSYLIQSFGPLFINICSVLEENIIFKQTAYYL